MLNNYTTLVQLYLLSFSLDDCWGIIQLKYDIILKIWILISDIISYLPKKWEYFHLFFVYCTSSMIIICHWIGGSFPLSWWSLTKCSTSLSLFFVSFFKLVITFFNDSLMPRYNLQRPFLSRNYFYAAIKLFVVHHIA